MRGERIRGRSPRSRSRFAREGTVVFVLLAALLWLAPALARAQSPDTLVLRWTAPADPGVGAVSRYDVRMSTSPISAGNFASATQVPSATPSAPGTTEKLVVRNLGPGVSYWFAVKSVDASGNWSPISNVLRWDGALDTTPPGTPTGFTAAVDPSGASVALHWNLGSEPDLQGYQIWRSDDAAGLVWVRVGAAVPGPDYTDTQLPGGVAKFRYALSAVDRSGNWSARTAAVLVSLPTSTLSRATIWHLGAPYPNPARTGELMHLPLDVPANAVPARIEILDGANHLVRQITVPPAVLGVTRVDWDGTNANGQPCAPGMYRAWLIAGDLRQLVRIARIP